jgi:hypothetical protein
MTNSLTLLPAPASRKSDFFLYLAVFVLFECVYLLFAAGHLYTVDSVEIYRTAESLVRDGDLEIVRPLPLRGVDTQHFYSKYGIGEVALAIPLYLLGDAVTVRAPDPLPALFQRAYARGFGGDPRIFFVSLLNGLVTAAACLVLFHIVGLLGFRKRTALGVALIYGFSTFALQQARDLFQHPLEALMLLASFDGLLRYRARGGAPAALLSGAALSYAVLTRLSSLVVLPVFAIAFLAVAWRRGPGPAKREKGDPRLPVRALFAFFLPLVLGAGVQLVFNAVRFGSPFLFGYLSLYDRRAFSGSFLIGLYGFFFSAGRSVFLYAPPVLAAAFAWPRFLKRFPLMAWTGLIAAGGILVLYARWSAWEGGWCWGPRFLLPAVPFLLLPAAIILEEGGMRAKMLLAGLVLAGLFVQLPGGLIDYNPIYYDWVDMRLNPPEIYLYAPRLSPVAEHWRALLAGRHLDLWILDVQSRIGWPALLAVLAPIALAGTWAVWTLRKRLRPAALVDVPAGDQ